MGEGRKDEGYRGGRDRLSKEVMEGKRERKKREREKEKKPRGMQAAPWPAVPAAASSGAVREVQ